MTYIWHVALGVGMATRETRDHLSDADLVACSAHIRRAIAAYPTGDPIPGHPDYAMAAQSFGGGALLCTAGRRADLLPLATFTVVTKSRHAAKAWQALHEGYPDYAASIGDVPRSPYCAVRAEMGLALDPGAGDWLDAYQVAVAWAWIERSA